MDKHSKQDLSLQALQKLLPSLYPFIQDIIATRTLTINGEKIRIPNSMSGILTIGKHLPEALTREQLENFTDEMTEQERKFAKQLAYQVNRNWFGMENDKARDQASNMLTGGRGTALILMKMGGMDKIFKNMQNAALQAGLTPGSIAGLRAQKRNQRIQNILMNMYSHVTDPDTVGKAGNFDLIDLSASIGPALQHGVFNDILQDQRYWNNAQLTQEGAKKLYRKSNTLGKSLSHARDMGLVSETPGQGISELTQVFNVNPYAQFGLERTNKIISNLDHFRRQAGWDQKSVKTYMPNLIKSYSQQGLNPVLASTQALSTMQGLQMLEEAGRGTTEKGSNPRTYKQFILQNLQEDADARMAADVMYAALASREGKDKAMQHMKEVLQNPENIRSNEAFIEAVHDKTGYRFDPRNLAMLKNSPDAQYFETTGLAHTPLLKMRRDELMKERMESLEQYYPHLARDLKMMGADPFEKNIEQLIDKYDRNNVQSGGMKRSDIVKNKIHQLFSQHAQQYGADYGSMNRFLMSVPTAQERYQGYKNFYRGTPRVQSNDYLDQWQEEMDMRKRMGEQYINKLRGPLAAIKGIQEGSSKGLMDTIKDYFGGVENGI